jgi:hypothetical protein
MKSMFAWFSIMMFGVILYTMPGGYAADVQSEPAYQENQISELEEFTANRETVIEELVKMWFMDIPGWEAEFRSLLNVANDSKLQAILNAESYAEVQAILGGGTPDFYSADSTFDPFKLGDPDKDFVYTPVEPCRIFDTRKAGGKILAYSSRNFNVHGGASLMIPQGGNPAGCYSPRGEPRAVHMNIAVVGTNASGFLTVWPKGASRPNAAVINYAPGKNDPISNSFTVKTGFIVGQDISVYARSTTHVVADVMGYYYDVVDLPGFEYSQTDESFIPLSTSKSSPTQLLSATLMCPTAGWIVAQATASAMLSGSENWMDFPWVGISLNTIATFDDSIAAIQSINHNRVNWIYTNLSTQHVWNCSEGQSITIFMTGIRQDGASENTRIWGPVLVLNYFSSRY